MSMDRQISQRAKIRSALERIGDIEVEFEEKGRVDTLEKDVARMYVAFDKATSEQVNRQQAMAGLVEAIVELVGAEAVDEKLKEISEKKALAAVANAKAEIQKGLDEGKLRVTEVVSDKSVIVGHEIDAEGKGIFPDFISLSMTMLKPEYKTQLIGKATPVSIETKPGIRLEVLKAYETVEKKAEPPPEKAEG